MPVIDLIQDRSSAGGSLDAVKVLRDGSAGRALVYDIKLSFLVADQSDADRADGLVTGASQFFGAFSGSDARGEVKVSPVDVVGQVVMTTPGGVKVAHGQGEVIRAQLIKAMKQVRLVVLLRLRGLDELDAPALIRCIGDAVDVEWERGVGQLGLPFAGAGVAPSGALQILTAVDASDPSNHWIGVQISEDPAAGTVTLSDFGEEHTVKIGDVMGQNLFCSPSGDPSLQEVADGLYTQMQAQGYAPSWADILIAYAKHIGVDAAGIPDRIQILPASVIRSAFGLPATP